MFSTVNEDYREAKKHGVSMKSAGFANAQLRVLAALLAKSDAELRSALIGTLSETTRTALRPFLCHPEIELYGSGLSEFIN